MKCNNRFQCDTKQFEFAKLCRSQDPMGCRLSGSTETLCRLELPQLHRCCLVQPCLMMSKDPPPPRHPLIHHFVRVGFCRAQIHHIDRFHPSYYQIETTGLCIAWDAMGCQFTQSVEMLCLLELPLFTDVAWCNLT